MTMQTVTTIIPAGDALPADSVGLLCKERRMMMRNGEFLDEMMQVADLDLMTPRMHGFFRDYLETAPPRRHDGGYVVNNFIPPFPGGPSTGS